MTDDDQVALPLNTAARVNHIAIGGCVDRIATTGADIDAAAGRRGAGTERAQNTPFHWPLPGNVVHQLAGDIARATAGRCLGRAGGDCRRGIPGRRRR